MSTSLPDLRRERRSLQYWQYSRRTNTFYPRPRPLAIVDPRKIPGLVALYNISDLSTLFVERAGASASTPASVDGVVGTVLDLSGNGFHFPAASDAARALLRESNGLYSLEFDGTDDVYQIGTSSLLRNKPGATMVVAHTPSSGLTNAGMFSVSTGASTGVNRCLLGINNGDYLAQARNASSVALARSTEDYTADVPTVQTTLTDWAGDANIKCRVNGVELASADYTAPANSPDDDSLLACLGGNLVHSSQRFKGHIYFAALYERALDSAELAKVEAYAAAKCGASL